jgi:hypothetical protein
LNRVQITVDSSQLTVGSSQQSVGSGQSWKYTRMLRCPGKAPGRFAALEKRQGASRRYAIGSKS